MLNKIAGSSALSAMPSSLFLVPEGVDTFASDCVTADNTFELGDTICAVAVGAPLPFGGFRQRRFQWIAPSGFVVQQTDIIADPQSDSFTVPTAGPLAQVGTWTVRLIRNNGATTVLARFSVSDPNNRRVNMSVSKSGPLQVTSGNNASYSIVVINRGPDDAQDVELTDTVPADMSFVAASQTGGPAFDCTTPSAGGTGTISCTRAIMATETTATFTFIFEVAAGTPNGTTIDNTAAVTSSTVELHAADNTSTAPVTVTGAGGGGEECVITCPTDVRVPHDPGDDGAIVTYPDPTTTGTSCGAISCSQASGTFFPIGVTTVVCAAETGNPCEFLVIVEDEVSPTISCPSDMSVDENPVGSGSAVVTYPAPTASDDSGTVNVSCDRPSGSTFPSGTTTVTCTATDPAGNQDTCTFDVTVSGTPCELTCPANIVVDASGNACGAIVNYPAPTATGCGTVTSTPASGTFFNLGTTTVTVTTSNGASCEFTVTVNEHVPPTVTAPAAQTADAGASCEVAVPDFVTGLNASDNCTNSADLIITQDPGAGTIVGAGAHNVSISVSDGSNNTTTVNTTFTVTDSTAPVITLNGGNPITVECHTSFTDPGATADDNCAGSFAATASGTVDVNTPGTYTITYNASDPSGNPAAPVTRTVNVVDTTSPVITLNGANPMTVECHTSFTDPGATANDSCAGSFAATASGTVDVNTPGTYTITYNASDPSGNPAAPVTRTVIVVDTTPPVITLNGTNPTTVECHTSFTDPGASATDSCAGSVSVTASGTVNVNVPGTYTITYTATDGTNTTTVTRTVNVVDTIAPVITLNGANPITVECHTSFTDPGATATDSCAGSRPVTVTGSVNANVPGTYTLTYSASDGNGHTTTVTRTVIVGDSTLPTITLTGTNIQLWPPNHKYVTINLMQLVASASDSCDGTVDINDVVISKVTSDELENSGGDGNTLNDIVIAANCKSVQLRAERDGGGNGRVYTIHFKVTDVSGRVGTKTAQVKVPKSQGNGGGAVDSGVKYTVNGTCP